MTNRGGLRGLGLGIVSRFTGDTAGTGAAAAAVAYPSSLDPWYWDRASTPQAVVALATWDETYGLGYALAFKQDRY